MGWRGSGLTATIDLERATPVHAIQMRFLQQSGSLALLPRQVTFAESGDGTTWRTLQSTPIAVDPQDLRLKKWCQGQFPRAFLALQRR